MASAATDALSINANFAAIVINRAAELPADAATRAELGGNVIGALAVRRNLEPADERV